MNIINDPTGTRPPTIQTDEGMKLTLTPREELAVIVQRLQKHQNECQDTKGKVLLGIAADMVRTAVSYRE